MANPIVGMFIRPLMQRRNKRKLTIADPKGIREEQFVMLGGIEQWVTIRGQDRSNPVLVILHGGPASPYTPFNSWLGEWEQHFTIAQWDQRGAGKTFKRNGEAATGALSFQKLAEDGIELVEYVRKHLGVKKVILLGSSVGSFIGLLMIRQRPDLFCAYVGAEQNGPGGIEASYVATMEAVRQIGDKKGVSSLVAMGTDKTSWTYRQYLNMNKLAINATKDVPHMINDVMLPALLFAPDYKMSDIKAVQKGMDYSAAQLFVEMKNFDFEKVGYKFDVPFFVFQGESDILTPVQTAKAYVERIQAPKKTFVSIPHAGHLAEFCNPHQFLQDLLKYVSPCV
ncbi:MAG TPA: alpha/beta hydrolase [Candidatus Saccharimonadales bacterium]|nr:alpha/beta hydrolase [Candidatus Saccharimonadales bacterium]